MDCKPQRGQQIDLTPVFAESSYSAAFNAYRTLPDAVLQRWLDRVEESLSQQSTAPILMDLGCGSGHFTLPFSRMLSPYKGRVLGIDRSSAMLASLEDAVMRHSINNVSLIHSDFCCYEPLEQISVFFASEVLHACDDLSAVFTHASSLGCPGSMFVIRTPSHDQLRQIRWLSFFEGALELDLARTVDIAVMCDHLRRAGFDQNVQVEVIHEAHAISSLSFLSALEDKAYSLLRVLPSAEFAKGLQRASQYCAGKLSINNNLNMTCIRARRP